MFYEVEIEAITDILVEMCYEPVTQESKLKISIISDRLTYLQTILLISKKQQDQGPHNLV